MIVSIMIATEKYINKLISILKEVQKEDPRLQLASI